MNRIVRAQFSATSAPTGTHRESFDVASNALGAISQELVQLVEVDMAQLGREAEVQAQAKKTVENIEKEMSKAGKKAA